MKMKSPEGKAYSVSQVNARVERLLDDDSMLADVAVEGEVSNCKYNQSGHIYCTEDGQGRGGYSTESTSVATYSLFPRQGRVPM